MIEQTMTDFAVMCAMRKYGGGFIAQLAIAAMNADEVNLTKIKTTWPEDWAKYTEFAKLDKARELDCQQPNPK